MTIARHLLKLIAVLALAGLSSCADTNPAGTPESGFGAGKGRFPGDLIVKVLDDGRRMQLAAPFEYIDSRNKKWVVPPGETVDGASIPEALWSTIGGPFSGRYRKASVIHDFFCGYKVRPAKEVHGVFYDAMRTSGVGITKAKLMLFAVLRFGPDWRGVDRTDLCNGTHRPQDLGLSETETNACAVKTRGGPTRAPSRTAKFSAKDFEEAKKAIEAGNLSLDQIKSLAVAQRF